MITLRQLRHSFRFLSIACAAAQLFFAPTMLFSQPTSTYAQQTQHIAQSAARPTASIGHDQYGYQWQDDPNFNWIDATGGTLTGASKNNFSVSGPIALPFAFKYYGQSFTDLYVSWNGFVSFTPGSSSHVLIPLPQTPNGLISPYNATFGSDNDSGVYLLTGGSAPIVMR